MGWQKSNWNTEYYGNHPAVLGISIFGTLLEHFYRPLIKFPNIIGRKK